MSSFESFRVVKVIYMRLSARADESGLFGHAFLNFGGRYPNQIFTGYVPAAGLGVVRAMESLISCAVATGYQGKSLPAWREETKNGDEEVKYGHRTRT